MAANRKVQTMAKEKTTEQAILDDWLPAVGCLGYGLYSVKIMHPNKFSEVFGSASPRIEDGLWAAAGVGLAVYIYRQKCLQKATVPWRVTYSGFGSTFFNLGSNLLMWLASNTVFHRAPTPVKLLAGLSCAGGLLYIGDHYMTFLNNVTKDDGDQVET